MKPPRVTIIRNESWFSNKHLGHPTDGKWTVDMWWVQTTLDLIFRLNIFDVDINDNECRRQYLHCLRGALPTQGPVRNIALVYGQLSLSARCMMEFLFSILLDQFCPCYLFTAFRLKWRKSTGTNTYRYFNWIFGHKEWFFRSVF